MKKIILFSLMLIVLASFVSAIVNLEQDLQAFYEFEGNVLDTTGKNDATNNGAELNTSAFKFGTSS